MTAETPGLDWSTARPAPALLIASGFRFVMRYVSPLQQTGPNPKDVSATELRELLAAGLAVGLVYESTAGRALQGAVAGRSDGILATARARTVGYPAGCALFYSVDFDATAAQLPAVTAYAQAFASAVDGYVPGGYGGGDVVDQLAAAGRAGACWWQAAGWSHRRTSANAHLLQRVVKHWPDIPGTDENVLLRPLPLAGWQQPAPSPSTSGDDDMPAAVIIRNGDTGEMALLAPGLFYKIPSPPYVALYVAAGLVRGPAPTFTGNSAQYNHLRDVALSSAFTRNDAAPALSELQAILGLDQRILDAVDAAHPAS